MVSWGYQPDTGYGSGSSFIDYHEWQGTREMAAFLSTPAAIQFQRDQRWENVREECHQLAVEARQRITELTNIQPLSPASSEWFSQMFSVELPTREEAQGFQKQLLTRFRIEAPVMKWHDKVLLRVSIQGYNNQNDIEHLIEALGALL